MSKKVISDADKERYNKNRREKHRRLNPPKPKEEIPEGFRKCTKCKELKPETTEYFNRSKDSFQLWCKGCRDKHYLEHREERIEKNNKKYRELHPLEILPEGMKRCSNCKEIKPTTVENFRKSKKSKDGFRYQCEQCRRDYYKANSDEIIEKAHKYYGENKEQVLETCKRYRENHPEWYRNYNKSYYIENRDIIKQRVGIYYHENKNKLKLVRKIYGSKWNHSPHGKELKRYYEEKRRSLKAKLLGTLTMEQWENCKEYFGYKCAYCGEGSSIFHQEHVIPVSNGGHYTRQNIIPACQKCNNGKWAHDMEDWYKKQPFYSEIRLRKIHKWTGTNPIKNTQQIAFF